MKYRLGCLVLALAVAESAYFYWQNRDVVSLSRPVESLAADSAFPDTARRVLARERATRRVLERIADAATRTEDGGLKIAALERIARQSPDDRDVRMRLAEALRETGRLAEAESIYRSLVAAHQAQEGR